MLPKDESDDINQEGQLVRRISCGASDHNEDSRRDTPILPNNAWREEEKRIRDFNQLFESADNQE
jgi:hypothetical protein